MATYKDYLPEGQYEFDNWQRIFIENANANAAAWNLPADELAILNEIQSRYKPAFAKGNKDMRLTRTGNDTSNLSEIRKEYEAAIRDFVRSYVRFNKKIESTGRLKLGVTVPDTIRTRRGTPQTHPNVICYTRNSSQVMLRVRQQLGEEGTSRRGKPKDVARIEVAWFIGDNPPPPDEFANRIQYGRSPIIVQFPQQESGKKVTLYCRFIGFNNQPGRWGAAIKQVVTM